MEITVKRTGECRQCGWCCQKCLHLTPRFKGVIVGGYKCGVYETRDKFCEKCGQTHGGCLIAPDVPFRKWNPYCGYEFLQIPSEAEIIEFVFREWDWFETHGSKSISLTTETS